MNKILVVEDKNIKGGEYILETNKDVSITVQSGTIIHDINNTNNLKIKIDNNSSLHLYQIKNLNSDYNLDITLLKSAKLSLHLLILNKDKHKVTINISMVDDNSYADIDVRAINTENNSNLDLICNGYIKKNTKDNELIENLKGLITKENDSIKISPNMLIDTNEVSANHLVTIGTFTTEELFYLKTKGLSEQKAKDLLIEAFLKQHLTKTELEYLNIGGETNE